ncbi:CD109 antigen-like [Anopheles aquasalis]|uniref:CD109 antigen-like n=1 Tax=Anopheles aquasalis TaxID=42839 RepID=UPI00215B261F|nr:CD109 antigen-like [Anopheles aquasalis]XP_050091736.1 CD109 antigen-like [Anopheles aquasalis]
MPALRCVAIGAALIAVSMASKLFIVGPDSFRSNQNYTVAIQNLQSKTVTVAAYFEGFSVERSLFNIRKHIFLRPTKAGSITFQIPFNESTVSGKLTIEGINRLVVRESIDLEYKSKSIHGFIQLSKPVYKPENIVQFRVIVLNSDLKPPSGTNLVTVTVQDPVANTIRQWDDVRLYNGVFDAEMDTNSSFLPGSYNIKVETNKEQLVSKTFAVEDYVLFPIEVDVTLTTFPLVEHQALNLTISANYYFGKPIDGTVKIELYGNDELQISGESTEQEVNGILTVHLPFAKRLNIEPLEQNVKVHVNFTEKDTNRTMNKTYSYKVYKYKYQAKLEQVTKDHESEYTLKITHGDTPAKAVTVLVEEGSLSSKNYTTDEEGIINLSLKPFNSTQLFRVSYERDEILSVRIDPLEKKFSPYITVRLKSDVKRNEKARVNISCSHRMTFVTIYVVSKGNIIEIKYIRLTGSFTHNFGLNVTDKMLPRSTILVVTIVDETIVYEHVYIEFNEFANNFDLRLMDEGAEVRPGEQIELNITAPKRAYVALMAYEKSFLNHHGRDHDIYFEDIRKIFDQFHGIDENNYNFFHTLGLFSRPVISYPMSGGRSSRQAASHTSTSHRKSSKIIWRAGLRHNWLWKNITISDTNQKTLIEHLPNALTSWYLSGFSIDPVHGFGIIKKPLELSSVQPFCIVDYLPNSIKLGEKVQLRFTLFSAIGGEYKADVTLYNVNKTIEFFDRPAGDDYYTKYLLVPTKVGVPVSFWVKATQTGKMIVRVKASIPDVAEHDGLEQIIRVE